MRPPCCPVPATGGDSLVRGIGFGQHPIGFDADFLDGLLFEPRVTLGALAASDLLLDVPLPAASAPVFHYQFSNATPLPSVPDASSAGNAATAGAGAMLSTDIPEFRPVGSGNRSLATATAGALTTATSLLANSTIESRGGFSMECWFRWDGGGGPGGVGPFPRGDCDGDGLRNITDGVFLLNYLFLGGTVPPCLAACDNDGSGAVPATPTDALNLVNFLFLGGAPLPEPLENCATSSRPEDASVGCADTRGCV